MLVTMLLADFAQVSDGKLTVVGGGWSLTGPEPVPFGIAILIRVPWDQANQRHLMRLELLDADGQPVEMETEDGQQQVVFFDDVPFEVGRPAGLKPGTPLRLPRRDQFGAAAARARPLRMAAHDRQQGRRRLATALLGAPRGRRGLRPAPEGADEASCGDDGPDELQDEESPLRAEPCVDGEHRRPDEVDRQIHAGRRVEDAALAEDEAREDQQGARELNELMHENLRIE